MAACLAGCGQPVEQTSCPSPATCNLNTLQSCGEQGELVETDCGEDRCVDEAAEARCVPANALPCDRFDMDRRCVNGRITECDVAVGYRLERSCEVGFLCVGDGTNARCDDIRTLNCQENVWSPICVDDTLYVCRENRVVSQDRCG